MTCATSLLLLSGRGLSELFFVVLAFPISESGVIRRPRMVQEFLSFTPISSREVCIMSGEEWSRAMRAIWLLNTIEVELSHLGIPLMRVPPTLRTLADTLAQASMSEQDRQLIADELTHAHSSLAQAVEELQA